MAPTLEERISAALERLPSDDQVSMKSMIEQLSDMARSLDALMALMLDPGADLELRTTACWLLGRVGEKRAAPALLSALRDNNEDLLWTAAVSLGLLRSRRALRPLVSTLLHDGLAARRAAAAWALGDLGDRRAVDPLIQVLSNTTEASRVRARAAEALGYLMDSKAVPYLIDALRDRSPEVRYDAAFAFTWLRDRRALPELERVATEDAAEVPGLGSVREVAAEAIKRVQEGWAE